MAGTRARDLGIAVGTGTPGPHDAITDVAGVLVGHTTLIGGEGRLVVGKGPIRTGVTVVLPHGEDLGRAPVFAGTHRLNGNGEMTGLEWIRESGLLTTPIALTNTHSVGVVRDALIAHAVRHGAGGGSPWSLPVVAETWDGRLNDIDGFHVRPEHVDAALQAAAGGPVVEGNVGGGTGMVCHGFKGGIGTASRVLAAADGGWTVGVLVQANYGRRQRLRVDGAPVGEAIPPALVPLPADVPRGSGGEGSAAGGPTSEGASASSAPEGAGSIIVIVATDAPLLPHQCDRLAQRSALGVGRMGGVGETTSGDLMLAFSTAQRLAAPEGASRPPHTAGLTMLNDAWLTPLFDATVEATEEAILNALLAAETMTGRDGVTAHALPHDLLVDVLGRYGRLTR